jgi:hypothetical protein
LHLAAASAHRCSLFWSRIAARVCGVVSRRGLFLLVGDVVVGLLVMDQQRLVAFFRFYLGFISVQSQCNLGFDLSVISV